MNSAKGMGQPNPERWLGLAGRILVTLFFLLLVWVLGRCAVPTWPVTGPPSAAPAQTGAQATLRVEVEPQGARVLVDGLRSGTTPVTLRLPMGRHDVRVEMDGYQPLAQSVDLPAGGEATVVGDLVPVAMPPGPTVTLIPTPIRETAIPLPDLAIRHVQIALETGGDCNYTSTQLGTRVVIENIGAADAGPFIVAVNDDQQVVEAGLAAGQSVSLWFKGYAAGSETRVVLDPSAQIAESSEENNSLRQMVPIPTLPPTCTPPPAAPPTDTPLPPPTDTPEPPSPPAAAVTVHEGQVTIPTYPYADFSTLAWNETFHMPYAVLDREAYNASNPTPRPVTYRTLIVENEYLQLTFLPDIGGRLYEVVYKPTGHRQTYRNPVLKPSPWGPPEQGWWLAAGGIEWCLPVEEHGYEWGTPWKITATGDGRSIAVTLRDTEADAADRMRARIVVKLEAGAAYFTIQPRLENPTSAPLAVKYWTNAMLAPGGQNAPSADLRFVLPDAVTAVTVHSRGDENLPGPGERMPWPVANGVDYSRLGNWNRWLGFFEDPAVGEPGSSMSMSFMAVYDVRSDEGMVRAFPANVAKGAKIFAFGWSDPIPPDNWTDDGSGYVEIHGGPAPTFDDSVTIPAGGALQWTETWYPVAGLGGLRYANQLAALNLSAGNGQVHIGVMVNLAWSGELVLKLNERQIWSRPVSLLPGQPWRETVPLGADVPASGQLTLFLGGAKGSIPALYSADFKLK